MCMHGVQCVRMYVHMDCCVCTVCVCVYMVVAVRCSVRPTSFYTGVLWPCVPDGAWLYDLSVTYPQHTHQPQYTYMPQPCIHMPTCSMHTTSCVHMYVPAVHYVYASVSHCARCVCSRYCVLPLYGPCTNRRVCGAGGSVLCTNIRYEWILPLVYTLCSRVIYMCVYAWIRYCVALCLCAVWLLSADVLATCNVVIPHAVTA